MLEDQGIVSILRKSLPNSWCHWNTIHTFTRYTFFDLLFLTNILLAPLPVSFCILCKVPAHWPSWPYPYRTMQYPYALPRTSVPASTVCAFAFCSLFWPAGPQSAMPVLSSLLDFSGMGMESSCALWKVSKDLPTLFCSAQLPSVP